MTRNLNNFKSKIVLLPFTHPLFRFSIAIILTISVASLPMHAAIIFDNIGTPGMRNPGGYSDLDAGQIVVDDFSLSLSDTIRAITVYGQYYDNDTIPPIDNFSIRFYNDLAGMPGGGVEVIASSDLQVISRTDTGLVGYQKNLRVFKYELDLLSPRFIQQNTPTWISVINDTSGGVDVDDDWIWSFSFAVSGNAYDSQDEGRTWRYTSIPMFFQLHNSQFIPEPTTLTLATLVLIPVVMRRRR